MRVYRDKTVDEEFRILGSDGFSGSLNDRQFNFLRALNFKGTVSDMLYAWATTPLPVKLFELNEQGVWFDPDPTTTFTDTAGTTPAQVGQAVALLLDKSQQQTFEARRNLLVRTEEFDVSPWAVDGTTVTSNFSTAPDGTATAERLLETTATAAHAFSQTVSTIAATQHVFSVYIKKGSGATAPDWVQLTFGGASTGYANFNLSTGVVGVVSSATAAISNVGSGWYRCSVIVSVASAGAVSVQIVFTNNTDSASRRPSYAGATTSDVSVWGAQLEVGSTASAYQAVTTLPTSWLGNHATQSILASRPTLARVPANGRRNLLVNTVFAGAVTGSPGTVPTAWTADINNATITALGDDILTVSAANQRTVIRQASPSIAAGAALTWYAQVTVNSGTLVFNQIFDMSVFAGPTYTRLLNGVSVAANASVPVGTHTLQVTVVNDATPRTFGGRLGIGIISDQTGSVSFFQPQLETGSTATAYQRVGSTFDVTEAGQPDNYFLSFDGIDDFLVTPTITPGIDKAQVFAGVRKLSDAADAQPVTFGLAADNGRLAIDAPGSGTAGRYQFVSRGTATSVAFTTSASFSAPNYSVISGLGDIAGDSARLRINGTQVSQVTTDQGTGNYLAYPLYIGRRGGTTLPFNGHLYSLVVRFGANLDAGTISSTERYVALRTAGVSL
jgi:hypothetical protein